MLGSPAEKPLEHPQLSACQDPLFAGVHRVLQLARTPVSRTFNAVWCRLLPHHQYIKVNRSRLAFFLARSRVFAGTPADSCGLPSSGRLAHLGLISLSPGRSSLQPRSPAKGRSPQRPQRGPIQINGLRADESNGWITVSLNRMIYASSVLTRPSYEDRRMTNESE